MYVLRKISNKGRQVMAQKQRPQAETLSGLPQPNFTGYAPASIIAKRSPTSLDVGYPIGQLWVNKASGNAFQLTQVSGGSATWVNTGVSPSGSVDTLTGNTGGAISPSAGNINIVGGSGLSVAGSGSTLTINRTGNDFPITPYVVGPIGQAGYQTIQSAVNAANIAGGGTVYVQDGTYTENLTLYDAVQIVGTCAFRTPNACTIIGVHTPPATGKFSFTNVTLQSATSIFNSAVAGTAQLIVADCQVNVTNGYLFNVVNWTGILETWNTDTSGGTNDGGVNNTGGSTVYIYSSGIGAGSGNTMNVTGTILSSESNFYCPVNFQGGANIQIDFAEFVKPITFSGSAAGLICNSRITTDPDTAIHMNSSGVIKILSTTIDSSAVPVIDGTATLNQFYLADITYLSGCIIASTVFTTYSRHIGLATPYVVGLSGNYTTIQDALDAMKILFGPKIILIQPGLYIEDLDFSGTTYNQDVHLVGLSIYTGSTVDGVCIVSNPIVPSSGLVRFENINLEATSGDFIASSDAGTTEFVLKGCTSNILGGYLFNLPNWTGVIRVIDHNISGPSNEDGFFSNTGGAVLNLIDSTVGTATGATFTTGGNVTIRNSIIMCPSNFGTGSTLDIQGATFKNPVTVSGNCTGNINFSSFFGGSSAAVTMSSSAAIQLGCSVISSSNNPSIAGSGAGTITLGDITFIGSNSAISGTLTVAWSPTKTGSLTVTGAVTTSGGAVTINSGTNALGISTDASATTVSLATGGAVKAVTLGSTNSTSATTVQSGSGALNVTSATGNIGISTTNGTITLASGTGEVDISADATNTTVKLATGAGVKLLTIGSTNSTSATTINSGSGNLTLVGKVLQTTNPAFLLTLGSTANNVTGNGTTYTLGTGATLTKVYDRGTNATTSGVFTAPVTGLYDLRSSIQVTGTTIATTFIIQIVTTARTYSKTFIKAAGAQDESVDLTVLADMSATDTATITITVSGEAADTADILGGATVTTYFCGRLAG